MKSTIGFALPIWILWLLTTCRTTNRVTIRLRRLLHRPFLENWGRQFAVPRRETSKNLHNIEVRENVYLAYHV